MGKLYDFTLTVGADDSAANSVLALLEKNLLKATKKDNVISIKADASNVDKALRELSELNPKVGASIELVIDQSQLNKEVEFLNSIINSKTNLDADKIISKFKSSFTSGIKQLKLGDILTAEVGDNIQSVANVQKAVDEITQRLSEVDLSKSLDFSEMTTFLQDLEKANVIIKEISKQKKLSKVNLNEINEYVDTDKIKQAYSQVGKTILMNQDALLSNLKNDSIKGIEELQNKLRDILKYGAGNEIVPEKEFKNAQKRLKVLENNFVLSSKSIGEVQKSMHSLAIEIENAFDQDDTKRAEKLQKTLLAYNKVLESKTGRNLLLEDQFDKNLPDEVKKIITNLIEAKEALPNYEFQIVTEEDVEAQRTKVNELKESIEAAGKAKKEAGETSGQIVDDASVTNAENLDREAEKLLEDFLNIRKAKSGGKDDSYTIVSKEEIKKTQDLEQEVESLNTKLESTKKEVEDVREAYEKADAEATNFASRAFNAEVELEEAQKKLDSSKYPIGDEKAAKEIDELRGQLEKVNDELDREKKYSSNLYDEFAQADTKVKELTEQLQKANSELKEMKIKVEPEIDPEEFAKQVTKQLTIPAQIDVEGKVSDPEKFKWDVAGAIDYIPLDVTFREISDDEILEFKKSIETIMPILAIDIPVSIGNNLTTEDKTKKNIEVGVSPVVESPEAFASEVSKQLTVAAQIPIEGKINAKQFSKGISDRLATSTVKVPVELGKISKENSISKLPSKIEVKPKITSPKEFADSVSKQAKVPAEIAVKPDAEALKTFKSLISAMAKQAQDSAKTATKATATAKTSTSSTQKTTSAEKEAKKLSKNIDVRKDSIEKLKNKLLEINKLTPEIQSKFSSLQKSIARVSTAKGLEKFDAKFKEVKQDADNLTKSFKATSNSNQKLAKTFKALEKNAKQYANLQSKLTLTGKLTEQESNNLDDLRKEYESVSKGTDEFRIATDASTESIEKATAARQGYLDTFNETYITNVNKAFTKYQKQIEDLGTSKFINPEELYKITTLINEINTHPIDVVTEEGREKIESYSRQIQEFFNKVDESAKEVSIQGIGNEISQYLEKNTALSLKFRVQLHKLAKELKSGITSDRLKEIYTEFLEIQKAARDAGEEGKHSLDIISQRLSDMDSKFLAQLLSWQDIIRYIREVANTVVELDTALTEMRKVSDESLASLQKYQNISFGIADEIGVTGQRLQESTADFMRLGESLEDASESARVANVLMNVSEFESISEATDALIAMSAAYSDLEKMDIVDKLNEIGNNYSISTDGIANALQDSASALVTAYNSIDEAIALITAGNAVVQDPNKVGNGLRTIALRLTGTKEAAEALADLGEETDNMITTQSKLRETIMNATKAASANGKGFDILDDNGNYKSTYEIMLGLAELYDEIVKKDKELGTNNLNLLLETIAGKNRANIAASILQNPDLLKDAFNDSAINAANSALEENQKYLESIQGHIQKFQNAVQQLFHYLLESGLINDVIDGGTRFINLLTELVKTLGSVGSLATAGGLILLLRNSGKIITSLGKKLPEVIEGFELLSGGAGSLKKVLALLFPTITKVVGALAPFAPYIVAIGTALYAGYKVWDYFTITVEEATEELEEFESKYSELRDNISNQKKVVDECAASYEELAQGVDTLTNKNKTLSDEDYQRYLDITNQLADAFPQIIKKADEYGGTILTIGENWETATEALKKYISEEERAYLYERYKDLGQYSEAKDVTLSDLKEELTLAEDTYDALNNQIEAASELKKIFSELNSDQYVNLTEMLESFGIGNKAIGTVISDLKKEFDLDRELHWLQNEESWYINLSDLSEEEKAAIDNYFDDLLARYNGDLAAASEEVSEAQLKYETEWAGLGDILNDSLQFLLSGDDIDPNTRELAEQFVSSLSSDIVEQFADESGKIDYEQLVSKWAAEFKKLDLNQTIDFLKLFNPEVSPEEKVKIYYELKKVFEDMGIEIPIDFLIEDEEDVLGRLKTRIGELSKIEVPDNISNPSDLQKYDREQMQATEDAQRAFDELFDELEINTVEEYNKILDIIKGCETWEEAVQKVRDAYAAASQELESFDYNSLEDAISDVNTKLLPQFEKLGELYDEIFNGDNGFDLSGIGTSDLYDLIETFEKLDAALEIEPPTDAIDEFIHVIANSSSTTDQVQKAFNALATAYFNAAVEAGNFSEENAVVMEQMLTEMGIANASDVVDYYEDIAKVLKYVADNEYDLADANKTTIDTWIEEVGASEETAQALYVLALKQIFLNENWINEETSIEQVLGLASAAGVATDAVERLLNIQSRIGDAQKIISDLSGKTTLTPIEKDQLDGAYQTIDQLEKDAAAAAKEIQDAVNNFDPVDVEFSIPKTGSGGSASEAGKDAADEYVKAFEEELEALEKQRDAGIISEKEFLERYKDLIERYFKDVDGYAEEYAERMHDYFDRLTSYYENVFSAIGTILSHRISALEKAKSAAVASINAEKEAAAASYQAQIDYIDGLIDAKEAEIDAIDKEIDRYQDQIDAIDKQIDALEEANQKRQQAINLQKAQYELEKAQNQRTKLIYKGGQLVYENDTSAVRDAKENLEDAEFEIQKQKLEDLKKPLEEQIELLEKRKELIQDEIDGLQKQQEAIQKAMEASNKYYEQMIKETEAYWDALIEKLEDTKSKFEQIAELRDLAEAIDLINSYLGDTKYTIEDVWNGSPELIDQMLQDFINALMGANSANEDFKNSLALAAQEMGLSFDQISQDAKDTENNLNPLADALSPLTQASVEIGDTADALGKVAENSEKVATHTGTASTNSSDLATSLDEIAETSPDAARGLDETATNIQKEGDAAKEAAPHKEAFAKANEKIAENAEKVATNVGNAAEAIGEEGTNAENAYQSLNNLSNVNLASIVTQTTLLADAIGAVATALGLTADQPISAIETAITNLSQMSLGEESTGIIGSFYALETAVNAVTSAIGSGGGASSGEADMEAKSAGMDADANDGGSGGLIGAIGELHTATNDHVGTSAEDEGSDEGGTVISDFNALKAAVLKVAETIGVAGDNGEVDEKSLIGVIQTMPDLTQEPIEKVKKFFEELLAVISECVGAVGELIEEIKKLGDSGFDLGGGGGIYTGNVHIGEATGNVHAGNAYASGKLGIKKSENALVGEIGRELVYNPATGTYRTVGDHGPEITRLNKGDLIFNAEQTKAIIKHGKRDHGHSYAGGNSEFMPLTSAEIEMFKKMGSAVEGIKADVDQMLEPVKSLTRGATYNTTNNNPVINISDTHFDIQGVTGEQVARQISDTFEGMISHAYQRAMRK